MYLKALTKISYGMYIISSKMQEKLNAQIGNVAFLATALNPKIVISINKENLTHNFIVNSKLFSISILSLEADMMFIGKFGFRRGRDYDKFKDTEYMIWTTGVPIVTEKSLAYIEAEVINSLDAGTHTLFVGKIVEAKNIKDGDPMTYDYYHKVIKGKSPKTAPTYMDM